MERVSIRVDAGPWKIAFEGRRALYERSIEALVGQVIDRVGEEGAAPFPADEPESAPVAEVSPDRAPAPPVAGGGGGGGARSMAAAVAPSSLSEAAAQAVWKPEAPAQFHKFVADIGTRADDPGKQVMAFAFYLWNYEKRGEFTTAEVARFFRTFLHQPTDDLSSVLDELAHHRGFLDAVGDDGPWAIRPKGANYVKSRLLGQI